jgi:hypothetical protein
MFHVSVEATLCPLQGVFARNHPSNQKRVRCDSVDAWLHRVSLCKISYLQIRFVAFALPPDTTFVFGACGGALRCCGCLVAGRNAMSDCTLAALIVVHIMAYAPFS